MGLIIKLSLRITKLNAFKSNGVAKLSHTAANFTELPVFNRCTPSSLANIITRDSVWTSGVCVSPGWFRPTLPAAARRITPSPFFTRLWELTSSSATWNPIPDCRWCISKTAFDRWRRYSKFRRIGFGGESTTSQLWASLQKSSPPPSVAAFPTSRLLIDPTQGKTSRTRGLRYYHYIKFRQTISEHHLLSVKKSTLFKSHSNEAVLIYRYLTTVRLGKTGAGITSTTWIN